MQLAKTWHQRRHVPAAKPGGRRDAQVTTGLDAASRHAAFGSGKIGQQALAVFQKGTALVGERDAPCGAYQQLDTQSLLQGVKPTTHDGRRNPFSQAGCREAAPRGH